MDVILLLIFPLNSWKVLLTHLNWTDWFEFEFYIHKF